MKRTDAKTGLRQYSLVAIVMAAGIILSVTTFNIIRHMEMQVIKARFERDTANRINAVKREIKAGTDTVANLHALYHSSEKVTRKEFMEFTAHTLKDHDDIQALEWIPRVYSSERQEYESGGYPDFRITERKPQGNMVTAGTRHEYFPVYFIQPLKGNEAALGFDLASDKTRFKTMQKSRDTGEAAITSRVNLVQSKVKEFGFLEFYPVYRKGVPLDTVDERRENLLGFVLGVFKVNKMVERSFSNLEASGIDLYLNDETAPSEKRFLYHHRSRNKDIISDYTDTQNPEESLLSLTHTFKVADRNWSITAIPIPAYYSRAYDWHAWAALLSTILITLLSALYINTKKRQSINDKFYIDQIKTKEDQWRKTFDSITDMVSVHDKDMRIVKANRAFSDFLGMTQDEIIGRHCYELIHGTNEPIAGCPLVETYKTGNAATKEIFEPHFNLYLMITASPLREDGEITGAVHFIKDITRQKETDMERERLNRELEQIVYITSHDLRSPLVNVEGYHKEIVYSLERLKNMLKGLDIPGDSRESIDLIIDKEIPDSVRYIETSISKMDSLLSSLLKLSRTGKAEVKLKKLDMNSLVNDVISTFEHQFKEAGAKHEVSEIPPCIGDEKQINQVFSNLIGNALKYLDPERPGLITIFIEEENGMTGYCIEDNGIGISENNLQKIFELFHQVEPKAEGEGLGLNIVKKIVEKHGGKVWVESAPGRGSKFCISLPAGINRVES